MRATTVLYTSSHTELHGRTKRNGQKSVHSHLTALAPLKLNSALIRPVSHAYTTLISEQSNSMSSLRKPSRRAQTQFFPGDPRFGVVIKPRASDVACLQEKEFLSTALLDYIINLTTLVPDSLSFTEPGVQPLLGSLGAETFISSMNSTASIKKEQAKTKTDWKAYQGHICKARTKFKNILKHNVKDGDFKNILKNNIKDGNVPAQRLIIPIVRGPPNNPGHFFVACFDFSVHDPEFFVNVCFYDSLERARKRIH